MRRGKEGPEAFTPQWWHGFAYSLGKRASAYAEGSRRQRLYAACARYCRARAERGW